MPRDIHFQLDEHLEHAIAKGLRRIGVTVSTMSDDQILGMSDIELLTYCRDQRRMIITNDDDLLTLAGNGLEHFGIGFYRQGSRTIGQVNYTATIIWEIYDQLEMHNRVEFL
jgi:predicted nuclease of predicted toxin-antitoxin system